MEENKSKKITLFIMLGILVVGLIVGLVLVGQRQIFRAKAAIDITKAFDIKDASGNPISCSGDVCETGSTEVIFELKDMNSLIE